MTHAIHIFRKDLHRLRWAVVGWCAIVAGIGLVDTVGADVAFGGFGPQLAIRQMSTMLSVISALMFAILLARVVQDEPLVGRDAFWLTRPIESLSVMRAKLAFATSFLVVIPLAARVFVAAWYGTRPEAIIKIVPTFLFNQLIAIGVLWALAALTPSLVRYVIAIVGIIGTFVLLTASTLLIALFIAAETEAGGDYKPPDVTPAVVAGGLIILTALAVVVTQYRTRQVSRSLIAAAIGVIVVLFVPANWPWSFAAPQTSEVVSPLPALPSLSVSLDVSTPRTTESMTLSRRTPHSREIAVPALVGGLPSEFNIRAMVGRSRLEFSNGVVLEDRRRQTSARSYGYIRGSTGGRESAIEAALGGVRLLDRSRRMEGASPEHWATVLRVSEEEFVRFRSESGRLTTGLDILLERGIPRTTVPLSDGATAEFNDVRNKIVRVIRRATGCTVLFRRSYVESLFSPHGYRDLTYVLRNQARREAISSSAHALHDEGFSAAGFFFPTLRIGGRGFVLEQYDFEFPDRPGFNYEPVDLDESWLNGAELVVVEMVSAGYLTRPVSLNGFRMTP